MSEVVDTPMVGGKRRIDRVLASGFAEGLSDLDMDELRSRRDLARAEREYLSLVRRLLQGRRDILHAELERRRTGEPAGELVDRLAEILADAPGPSRGEAPVVSLPEEELTLARRRVEKLLADASLSDIDNLSEETLADAIARVEEEERSVSEMRGKVLSVHDALQDELKERYRAKVRDLPD
ncbi:MAG TPA: aerial mycelium formation protein [Actinomycetota bacterium]|nr:aerial mycelium formation protein [Actinomycetota bacterium]